MRPPDALREGPLPGACFDVAVVGAGVVGCAIARALARLGAGVIVLERAGDVGSGTSKANTAILHTGFDASPGTLESRLVADGYGKLRAFAAEVGVPHAVPGAVMVAWDEHQRAQLALVREKACENGYRDATALDRGELYALEPQLGEGALGGLSIPGEGIVCPWTTCIALATEALLAGARLALRAPAHEIARTGRHWRIATPRGEVRALALVNAAGLQSDEIDRLAAAGSAPARRARSQARVRRA
jgi:glycerol-3-phosphate dehydrogenase